MLLWDLDRQFRERAWQERRSLRADSMRAAGAVHGRTWPRWLAPARKSRAASTEFAARIARLAPRIAAMQAAIERHARHQQEGGLVALAERELQSQKERLASYRVQARFALATLYDRAASTQVAADARRERAP